MATPQLSPGVLVREVDLTVGRADNVLDNIGAIAGPFAIGPVDDPIDVTTEQELINVFGKPLSADAQYEYWMSASSFLSYGGVLKVVRTDGTTLRTANAGVGFAYTTSLKIKNFDDYQANHSDSSTYVFAAKNPGSWANNLKICMIDDKADQIVGFQTSSVSDLGVQVGYGVTVALNNQNIPGNGSVSQFNGYLKGIITGVSTASAGPDASTIDVKIVSRVSNGYTRYDDVSSAVLGSPNVAGNATTLYFDTDLTSVITTNNLYSIDGIATLGTITGVGSTSITVTGMGGTSGDVVSAGAIVRFYNPVSVGSTETLISYSEKDQASSIRVGNTLYFTNNSGVTTSITRNATSVADWYDSQTLNLTNTTIFWSSIAPKPISNGYVLDRQGKNDALHVVVVDDTGSVTGIQGNLLEKHLNLSKSTDAISAVNAPQKTFWKDYLALYSSYVYVGDNPSTGNDTYHGTTPLATGFSSGFTKVTEGAGQWNQLAQGVTFSALGNVTYALGGGVDYSASNGMTATLANLFTSYNLFSNKDEIAVDYLIMGPGLGNKFESQAKANHLISLANNRKDCIAVVSPHRADLIQGDGGPIINTDTQTDNVIQFFAPLSSSSYAIFDSGYKYTYDRFNNKFRYIPCNADVAGLCVRTSIFAYPWFSPAGQQRGILNNAIKLAYNPNKAQRDQLYPVRINSIVNQPGIGILLFGDKTALGYASAFDRINVRRLFLTVEQALQKSAEAQLFELNDQITRANFVNIVEPYLRDVQAKRGIYGFLVICDETNNTPDVIDNNEFRADIFLKPAKSINYVTLTFVATRTGVSFEEVAGRV